MPFLRGPFQKQVDFLYKNIVIIAKKSYVSLHDRAYKGDVRQYSTSLSLPSY